MFISFEGHAIFKFNLGILSNPKGRHGFINAQTGLNSGYWTCLSFAPNICSKVTKLPWVEKTTWISSCKLSTTCLAVEQKMVYIKIYVYSLGVHPSVPNTCFLGLAFWVGFFGDPMRPPEILEILEALKTRHESPSLHTWTVWETNSG